MFFERRLPWGRGYGRDIYPMAVDNRRGRPRKMIDLNLDGESSLADWDSSSFHNNLSPLKALDYIGIFGYN